MILTISVNRDSAGSDPWVTAVLPPAMLSDLRDHPAYSVVIMTLTDGILDSQEFRIIIRPNGGRHEWTLLSGRMATLDTNNGIVLGEADTEDDAVSCGVMRAVRLATARPESDPVPEVGFA